jgi:hypothetical protein
MPLNNLWLNFLSDVYASVDMGQSWSAIGGWLPTFFCLASSMDGATLAAVVGAGPGDPHSLGAVFTSTDYGA